MKFSKISLFLRGGGGKKEELNAVDKAGQWGSWKTHILCNKKKLKRKYLETLNVTTPLWYLIILW